MPKKAKHQKPKSKSTNIKVGGSNDSGKQSVLRRWLLVAIVLIFGGLGTYVLVSSYADTVTPTCKKAPSSAACKKEKATQAAAKTKAAAAAKASAAKKVSTEPAKAKPVTCSSGYVVSGGKCVKISCAPITGGNKCTDGRVTCANDYKLEKGACVSTVTCKTISGGQSCSNGKITCTQNYVLKGSACVSNVTCKAIDHGKLCTDGTIACNPNFTANKTKKSCTAVTCTTVTGGKNCGGVVTCNRSYFKDGAHCVVLTCKTYTWGKSCNNKTVTCNTNYFKAKADATTCTKKVCLSIIGGTKCNDNTVTCNKNYFVQGPGCVPNTPKAIPHGTSYKDGTIVCNAGYYNNNGACTLSVCTPLVSGHGRSCTNGTPTPTIKCDGGYTPNTKTNTCNQIVICNTIIPHGTLCNTGKANCTSGYYQVGITCQKITCTKIAHGQTCNNKTVKCDTGYYNANGTCSVDSCTNLQFGQTCKDGTTRCDSGYTNLVAAKNCVKVTCSPVAHGMLCNNNAMVCDTNYVRDGKTCVAVTCRSIPGGQSCSNDALRCLSGYLRNVRGDSCVKVTCSNISGGQRCTDKTVKCDSGYMKITAKDGAMSCKKITCKQDISHGNKCTDGTVKCDNGFALTASKKHCERDNSIVVAYKGYNDGCGGTATHYASNKKTHVSTINYGNGSLCKCSANGKFVPYYKSESVRDSKVYRHCSGTTSSRSTAGSTSYSGGGTHSTSSSSHGSGSSCSDGSWYTSGSGGGSTYERCSNGKWQTERCASGTVAVSSSSSSGPCVSHGGGSRGGITESACVKSLGGRWVNGKCTFPCGSANGPACSKPLSCSTPGQTVKIYGGKFCKYNGQAYCSKGYVAAYLGSSMGCQKKSSASSSRGSSCGTLLTSSLCLTGSGQTAKTKDCPGYPDVSGWCDSYSTYRHIAKCVPGTITQNTCRIKA